MSELYNELDIQHDNDITERFSVACTVLRTILTNCSHYQSIR